MTKFNRISAAASAALLLAVSACAGTDTARRDVSGTYTATYDNAAILVGFHTGKGTLVLNDGSEYAFTMDGYSAAGLGYSVATTSGNVYNLGTPADFSGEYAATGGAAVLIDGKGDAALRNRTSDAVIDVKSEQSGLRLGLGGGFVTFKLGEQLKGPRVAAVETPAPAPVIVPKPTAYEIEFGFDKSRVNLETGKLLDSIVADWRDAAVTFEVVGHADTAGSNAYNDRLSMARARNIRQALVERGVSPARVTARATGEGNLAEATADGVRKRANRRVVISIRDVK